AAAQIHTHDFLKSLCAIAEKITEYSYPGICYGDVKKPKSPHRFLDHFIHKGNISGVTGHRDARPPFAFNFLRSLFHKLVIYVIYYCVSPLMTELPGYFISNALARASDRHYLSIKCFFNH